MAGAEAMVHGEGGLCIGGALKSPPCSLTDFAIYFLLLKRSQHETAALWCYVKTFENKVVSLSGVVHDIEPESFILQGRGLQSNLVISLLNC